MGTCYLIHICPPYKHARHYLGWTQADNTGQRRFDRHKAGNGSPLIKAALQAGSSCTISRLWHNVDRNFERKLKNRKESPYLCPLCNPKQSTPT